MGLKKATFITPNPSIGMTYFLDQFEIGMINRCFNPPVEWADGKANIGARAFKKLGGNPIAVFPSGGQLGFDLEKRLLKESVTIRPVSISDEIRRTYSFSLRNTYPPIETHLLEKGPFLSEKELETFILTSVEACKNVDYCSISGSLPGGCTPSFYQDLIKEIRSESACKIILDTSDLPLKYGILSKPDFLKINEEEFCFLAEIEHDSPTKKIMDSIKRISIENKIGSIIVTRGSKSVLVFLNEKEMLSLDPPKIEVINTVGAGDCFTAGLIKEIDKGIECALKMAVATACSNILSPIPGVFDLEHIEKFKEKIEIIK